jgi:hypothetical protein
VGGVSSGGGPGIGGSSTANGGAGGAGAGTGGAMSTGGAANTGGMANTGGAVNTGGMANTGGSSPTDAASGGADNGGTRDASTETGTITSPGDGGAATCVPTCGSHKWACWPMPNPIGTTLPNLASYANLGNGIVRDNVTCLEWELTPTTGADQTWDTALAYCDNLALGGQADWRLPTRVEMASIVDFTKNPAIDRTAFTGAQGGFHKTSSDWILTITQMGAGAGRDFAWAFNLSDGLVSNAYSMATAARLRCVRGNGSGEAPTAPAVAPPNQYAAVASGEVRDNYTGLVWQQAYSAATMVWADAATYCAGLALNGHTWRVPSIRELSTLVDEAQVAPAINRTMFPNTQFGSRSNNWYWASHTAVGNAAAAWAINFDDGFTAFNSGAAGDFNFFTAAWTRCVR